MNLLLWGALLYRLDSQLSYTPIFGFHLPPLPDDFCIIAHNRKLSSTFFDFFISFLKKQSREGQIGTSIFRPLRV